jgi:pimeloyl-ACP methyl ester carboxylesterase
MRLPFSVGPDARAAFDGWLAACEADAGCRSRHPQLALRWQRTLEALPATVTVAHPFTGREETLSITPEVAVGLLRPALYLPALAAVLPEALDQATRGRWGALFGLASAMAGPAGGGRDAASRLAEGMHFSVVCGEDLGPDEAPAPTGAAAPTGASAATAAWDSLAGLYRAVCAGWPRGTPPADFSRLPPTTVPVLVLSGGLDPVTPPRHGQRVAAALGPHARHVVVPHAGHGVMAIGCMREPVFRFIDAADDAAALAVDADCAQAMPRPTAFQPVAAGAVTSPPATRPGDRATREAAKR